MSNVGEIEQKKQKRIQAVEQKHDKTRLPKRGMMQELLTGRTCLNHD